MRGKQYSDDTKAGVMAALLAGQGVDEVAKQYRISPRTASRWKAAIDGELAKLGAQKRDLIGELLSEYLKEVLITLTAQQRHFRDVKWLVKQNAADLAVLHGVSADKAFRLLEAIERTQAMTDHGFDIYSTPANPTWAKN